MARGEAAECEFPLLAHAARGCRPHGSAAQKGRAVSPLSRPSQDPPRQDESVSRQLFGNPKDESPSPFCRQKGAAAAASQIPQPRLQVPVSQQSSAVAGLNPGASQEGASTFGRDITLRWGVLGVQGPGAPSFARLFPWPFLHASRAAAFPFDPTFCLRWQESAVAFVGAWSGG